MILISFGRDYFPIYNAHGYKTRNTTTPSFHMVFPKGQIVTGEQWVLNHFFPVSSKLLHYAQNWMLEIKNEIRKTMIPYVLDQRPKISDNHRFSSQHDNILILVILCKSLGTLKIFTFRNSSEKNLHKSLQGLKHYYKADCYLSIQRASYFEMVNKYLTGYRKSQQRHKVSRWTQNVKGGLLGLGERSSGFLGLNQISFGHCGLWGTKPADRRSLSPSLYTSDLPF